MEIPKIITAKEFLDSSTNEYAEEDLIEFAKLQIKELFEEIKHGDQEHQDWLWNKMNEFAKNIK